ncbi:MAG: CatB-related O-acetyltransferase [Bacteroidales bacterium]
MKKILEDLRAYLAIRVKYPGRWPMSVVESAIPSSTRLEEPVDIKRNVMISSAVERIGAYTYIGNGASIFECRQIGRFCSISHGVKLGVSNHALDHVSSNAYFYSKSKGWLEESSFNEQETQCCIVEHDVLISANAIVMNGVSLGTGSVIGAGAFVNSDVPPYAIYAGTPARLIRYRFPDEIVQDLLQSAWWLEGEPVLRSLSPYFNNPQEFLLQLSRIRK